MQDLNDKVTGGTLAAVEWNEPLTELQNVIEALGITLSGGDLNQLGKAIAGYASGGLGFTDSGAADAYVLAAVGTKQAPTAYADGMAVIFRPDNTNTGIACTVNLAGIGSANVKDSAGNNPTAGTLLAGKLALLIYDATNTWFEVVDIGATAAALATPIATTAGAAVPLSTTIPAWATKVHLRFVGVSASNPSPFIIQIGDSGGYEITGYTSGSYSSTAPTFAASTIGFIVHANPSQTELYSGEITLSLQELSTNTWVSRGIISSDTRLASSAGSKSLSATLDRVQITTVGGVDTFDAGSISVSYEA